jgi:hypothetical protein
MASAKVVTQTMQAAQRLGRRTARPAIRQAPLRLPEDF